mgnify:CR=1 FL=1
MDYSNFLNWIEIFFSQIDDFISRDYVIGENKFIRRRNMTQKDITLYTLIQSGRSNGVEAFSFFKRLKNKIRSFSTRQAIGKQRKNLRPNLYLDMNNKLIDKIYKDTSHLQKFKGYFIFSNDGTDLQLPNHEKIKEIYYSEVGCKNLLKKYSEKLLEFSKNIDNRLKHYLARARVSCIVDSYSNLIIDVKIVKKEISEIELAIDHLKRLKKRNYDLKKIIFVYDRGYNSVELILNILKEESNFIIRLRTGIFKDEIKKMTTNDEFLNIKLNQKRLSKIQDPEIKEFVKNKTHIKLRITKVKLENGTNELLISNLPQEKLTKNNLKELYNKRWKIETVYDFLKNVMNIENFTGYSEIIVKQDFYTKILIYNTCMIIKKYTEHMEKLKNKIKKNQSINFNITVGIVKEQMLDILYAKTRKEIREILKITYTAIKKHKIKINIKSRKDMEIKSPDKAAKFHMNKRISTL